MTESGHQESTSVGSNGGKSPTHGREHLLSGNPYASFLGIKVEFGEDDARVYSMSFRDEHIGNPLIKTFHGGIIASFAEIVASLHLKSTGVITDQSKCTSMTFDYLRPAFAGKLRAEPQTVRAGKRFVIVLVDIFLEQSLVSRGRFIYSRASRGS